MARVSLGVEGKRRNSSRIFYGWWIVSGGFSLQMIVGSLMIHSFTAYFPILQTQFGWSRSLLLRGLCPVTGRKRHTLSSPHNRCNQTPLFSLAAQQMVLSD